MEAEDDLMNAMASLPDGPAFKAAAATRTVSATEARVHLGEVIRAVSEDEQDVIVQQAGTPKVAIISIENYERFRRSHPRNDLNDVAERFLALREEILAKMGDDSFGDVDDLIDYGQR